MVRQKHLKYKHSALLLVLGLDVLLGGVASGVGSAYRAFSTGSYWNTPFETNAPIDASSGTYIADSQDPAHSQDYLKFTIGTGYGEPVYFASGSDPLYTITVGSNTVQVHIPDGATPASGSDAQMTVYDLTSGYNRVVGLHGSTYSNGQYSANGVDSYSLSSNGLAGTAAGADDTNNFGHRGVSSATRTVRLDEIQAGAINHRLECFWWATAPSHYWPMVGHENNKGGIVPEGIVIRIKPGVNLDSKGLSSAAKIVATALQQYGCIVGDNSGSGNRLKLQANVDWTGILNTDSLQPISWSDWEFVQGGAVPQGQPITVPNSPPPPTDQTPPPTTSGGTGSPPAGGTGQDQASAAGSSTTQNSTSNSATKKITGDTSTPPTSVSEALSRGSTAKTLQNAPAALGSVVLNPSASIGSRLVAVLLLSGGAGLLVAVGIFSWRWFAHRKLHLLTIGQHSAYQPILVQPSSASKPTPPQKRL